MSSSIDRLGAGALLRDPGSAMPYQVGAQTAGTARAGAFAEGYAVGWAQGMREAKAATRGARAEAAGHLDSLIADRTARMDAALAAVSAAVDRLRSTTVQRAEEIAGSLLTAAVDLAESLVGAELAVDPVAAARAAVDRSLRDLPTGDPATVRLNPADHAELTAADVTVPAGVMLVADPSVAGGDAIAETAVSTVRAVLAAAVAAARGSLADLAGGQS